MNNGHRWHVRAFDRKSAAFRDFVLNRMQEAEIIADNIAEQEQRTADKS